MVWLFCPVCRYWEGTQACIMIEDIDLVCEIIRILMEACTDNGNCNSWTRIHCTYYGLINLFDVMYSLETIVSWWRQWDTEMHADFSKHHKVSSRTLHLPQHWGGEGYSQENWVGVCSQLPETQFQTKICDFPYPVSHMTKKLTLCFRPAL